MKLLKSLYGLKQVPITLFEKLKTGLLERGFEQSDFDPCLFMMNGIICVVYVDYTIFAGKDGEELEKKLLVLEYNLTKSVIPSSCEMKEKLGIS